MEALVSLEAYDPELRDYLLQHRYPTIMEALLTGLAVMVPRDPWEFVEEKLQHLRELGRECDIHWDMFVDASLRARLQRMRRGMLDSILDETDLPTEEMFEKAYHFRAHNLMRLIFSAWVLFHEREKGERAEFQRKMRTARLHYTTKITRLLFHKWKSYSAHRRRCSLAGSEKVRGMGESYMKRLLFRAWLEDYRETRRAKRWFRRGEPGGRDEGEEGEEEWHWPEGEDPVSLLPNKVAIKVFSQVGIQALCRCACVCRSWKEVSEDPVLWNRVDFFPIGHFVRDSVLNRLFHKYRPLLGHLNLRGCLQLTNDSLKYIGQCQNLQDLNLSECQGLSDYVMEQIAKGCSGLLYLNLSYCYITDSVIRILTKHCVSLHYLSLAYSPNFTSKGLHSISTGKGCRRLVYLDLSGCTQLTAEGMYYVGKGCPILNSLVLDDITECDDGMMLKLVAHCHTLRHISLLGGSKLTDKAVKYLAMENRKLKTIKIENNTLISDVALRAIGKACRELSLLYVAGCSRVTDQGLKALGSLKKLQTLNIADCTRVSDTGVRYIVENAPGNQLRELNLTNCFKISDVSLLRMSQSCKSLTYVCFCYCEHISDTGVELLGHIPSLTSLDLSGCNLSDQGVAGLRNNPQFKHLTLAELMDITDDGLQKMCSTLSKLETLDLCDCEHLTDTGVQAVAYNCRMLRTLLVAHCHQVSDEGTRFLSQGCKYLENLDMSGCNITDRSLRHLRKNCSNLKSLDILCCVSVTRDAVLRYQRSGVEVNYNTDRPKFIQSNGIADMPVEPLVDRI